ncbi:phage portal protein [Paenibacillus stellifer]|uniref:phage portal protein n=1 Tax=Paenibacillus stellifer TaxID=169760 RepID=UPI00069028B1|nr:phage portal protein [Paenibacillus stellifer]
MGIISRVVSGKRAYSLEDFDRSMFFRSRGHTLSGVSVTEESAMRFITVFSCIRVLAEGVGALPLHVYRRRAGGKGKDRAEDHPTFALLHDAPNNEMTSQAWRESQVGQLASSGNCYSVISLNRRGQVAEIYPVAWYNCRPVRNLQTNLLEYELNDRGKIEKLPAERILHIPGFGFDGIVGYSPIRMAAEAVGLGMAASEFTSRFYGQGMNIGSAIEFPNAMSPEAYERLRAWINETGPGLANSWKPIILEDGGKFSRFPLTFVDAQFIETRKMNRDEICGLFRVPPHMIANLERSTNNNIEHQSIEFVMHTLMPYLTRIEQACNLKLFTPEERAQGYYVKFNVSGLLRGDYKSRQEGLNIQRQNGIINADEWREMEEMNPIEDGSGEAYLVNGNMIPIEDADSLNDPAGEGGENTDVTSSNQRGNRRQ